MQPNVAVDKNSREYQENLLRSGRMDLVLVMALTVINIFSLLFGGGTYWVFSAAIPYYLTAFGYLFDDGIIGTYTATGLLLAAAILAVYLVCWIMSKKRGGWMTVALVLFAVDTAGLLILALMTDTLVGSLVDILLHAYVIFGLVRACMAVSKLKAMPQEPEEMPHPCPPRGPDLD